MLEVILLAIYLVLLFCILIYCIAESHLAMQYAKHKKQESGREVTVAKKLEHYPFVTVQLPIFNELYVVERLIDSIAEFDYPKDRFEIQVLDDSTDETLQISQAKVGEYKAKGYQIDLVRRPDRKGFKAGALQYGLQTAKGEYIAIFDADFLPDPAFLKATIPSFDDPAIGVVQTRWEHINENYSLLTKVQAFFLDAHFSVEQAGRDICGFFLNFNGTAGVWRRETILDAGGWQADTLTEDLDLSYRAQMKGWKFTYLEEFGSPAELPADIAAFKSQQFRWIKGGAETARKILPRIFKSDLPFAIKFNAFSHLMSSSLYIIILLLVTLSVPLLFVKNSYIEQEYIHYGSLFFLSNIAIAYVYYIATIYRSENKWVGIKKCLVMLPLFLVMTMGLSLHNGLAAIRGLLGEKTPFIRTPKFNIKGVKDAWTDKKYVATKISFMTLMEGFAALYFLGAIVAALAFESIGWEFLLLHVTAFIGFVSIFIYSLSHALIVKR